MTSMNQCWAIRASNGSRCTLDAGHTESHAVTHEWTDDECLTDLPAPVVISPSQSGGGVYTMNAGTVDHLSESGVPVVMNPVLPDPGDELDISDGTTCIPCDHPRSTHTVDGCRVPKCECVVFVG